MASSQVGETFNLSFTCHDRKNYLQSKRQRELAFGQVGSMLECFHDKLNFYWQRKKKNDAVQPQVELENDGSNRDATLESEDYNVLGSFTQLITAPTCAE